MNTGTPTRAREPMPALLSDGHDAATASTARELLRTWLSSVGWSK